MAISTPTEAQQSAVEVGSERRTRRSMDFSDLNSLLGPFPKGAELSLAARRVLSYLHETKRVCDAEFAMPADPYPSAFCRMLLFVATKTTRGELSHHESHTRNDVSNV